MGDVRFIMQTRREQLSYEMTLLPPLESLIPEDHRLRKLNRVLDLGFVHEAVRDRYCSDNGRPSIDPEVVVRLFLLQAIEGIRSIRELMREVQVNLAYRWFIGYRLEETLPDHSTLSKALERFGDEVFDRLFSESIRWCQASGLIEGRVLHVDATTIRADLDRNKVGKPDSADPDARYGHFADGRRRPSYKQHVAVDGQARVVVGMKVTAGDRYEGKEALGLTDQVIERLGTKPEAVCADMAYGSGENRAGLEDRGIRLISPPKPFSSVGGDCFTVVDFRYDETKDKFICPAEKPLTYMGNDCQRPDRRHYRASKSSCRRCALKGKCTGSAARNLNVGSDHAALMRLRADSHTDSFRQLYRDRAPAVEGVFAEEKCWHGLRRAWRRGLAKMRVQCFVIAAVINFKRLASQLFGFLSPQMAFKALSALYQTFIRPILEWKHKYHNMKQHTCSATPEWGFFNSPLV
jgi:transposase